MQALFGEQTEKIEQQAPEASISWLLSFIADHPHSDFNKDLCYRFLTSIVAFEKYMLGTCEVLKVEASNLDEFSEAIAGITKQFVQALRGQIRISVAPLLCFAQSLAAGTYTDLSEAASRITAESFTADSLSQEEPLASVSSLTEVAMDHFKLPGMADPMVFVAEEELSMAVICIAPQVYSCYDALASVTGLLKDAPSSPDLHHHLQRMTHGFTFVNSHIVQQIPEAAEKGEASINECTKLCCDALSSPQSLASPLAAAPCCYDPHYGPPAPVS